MSDTIALAVAGGLMLLTALAALRAAGPHAPKETEHRPAPVPERAIGSASHPLTSSSSSRPRILTGEPAAPESRKPASRRALKLVGGIAVLAAAGAFGLLAFVRALISLFDRIGG